MSYSFDGKIANQHPKITNYTTAKVKCEKCNKLIESPFRCFSEFSNKVYLTFSYIGTSHYIYETKMGIAIIYCSRYCRDKHNHRFVK